MSRMNAAVVMSFGQPPHYQTVDVPQPCGKAQMLVDVLAVGLHPRVRSDAAGTHYASTGRLPLIPGIDGVARREDGQLIYFAAGEHTGGTMAEKAVADRGRSVELHAGVDVTKVAAGLNPAMSSWLALRRRACLQTGQSVLVLGATGNAGSMAVQIARRLGAGRIVAAGRNPDRLVALAADADDVVRLADDAADAADALARVAADVDVVLDYVWGAPAQEAIRALLTARSDRSRPLDWIQIGALAGAAIELPSVALRSANLRLQGTGQGAVSIAVYAEELPALVAEIDAGTLAIKAHTAPLADVERVWMRPPRPGERTVLVP